MVWLSLYALGGLMALLLGYVGVLFAKALFIRSHQEKSTKDETTAKFMQYRLDIAQRLSEAIKCKTISYDRHGDQSTDYNELKKLRALIEKSYPFVNSRLEKRIINDYSIVYIWRGTDSSLLPALVSPAMVSSPPSCPYCGSTACSFVRTWMLCQRRTFTSGKRIRLPVKSWMR